MNNAEVAQLLKMVETAKVSQKPVLTLAELSQYTSLSKSCLYKLTSARKIPFSCPNGKTLYFDREQIDRWLLSNPVPTADEINARAVNYITLNPKRVGGGL